MVLKQASVIANRLLFMEPRPTLDAVVDPTLDVVVSDAVYLPVHSALVGVSHSAPGAVHLNLWRSWLSTIAAGKHKAYDRD